MYTNIYISAHKDDKKDVKGLSKYLKQLCSNYPIQVYSKENINVGDNIIQKTNKFIRFSKVIVCILTVDYLTECSDEIEGIFEYDTINEKVVIPIILKDCRIKGTKFENYKPLDFRDFEEKGYDHFWNHTTEVIEKIYKDRVISEDDIFDEDLIPKAFAGTSISNDIRLVNINTDVVNNESLAGLEIRGDKLMIRVIGESMTPDINNHDIVLCKKVETKINVYSPSKKKSIPVLSRDKFYVIETRNDGVVIKKVQEHKDDLILISSNNKEFDATIISKDEVISIWEVVSLIRNFNEN